MMGEAAKKALRDATLITFDLAGPKVSLPPSDRYAMAVNMGWQLCDECVVPDEGRPRYCTRHFDPALSAPRAVRALLYEVVKRASGGTIDGVDGRQWAVWRDYLDAIDDGAPTKFDIPWGVFRWMYAYLKDDKLKILTGMAPWRGVVTDYFSELMLLHEPLRKPAGGSPMMAEDTGGEGHGNAE
jgi:hypothetical protein